MSAINKISEEMSNIKIPRKNIRNKLCIKNNCNNCNNEALYGPLFQFKIHCIEHKLSKEFSHNNPKCEVKECNENAFYKNLNLKENYPSRCELHKKSNDKNIFESTCINCRKEYVDYNVDENYVLVMLKRKKIKLSRN
jgi:hypothetical protein